MIPAPQSNWEENNTCDPALAALQWVLNIQKTKIMACGPITSWEIDGETVADFILGGFKITADGDFSQEIKMLTSWKESYDQPRLHIKKQRHYFVNKGPSSQGYGFSSGHIWMWELD